VEYIIGQFKSQATHAPGKTEQPGVWNVSIGMTLVGHSLTGLAVAAAVFPSDLSRRQMAIGLGVFLILANIPDFALPGWGHSAYYVSHSIFVAGSLFAIALLVLWAVSMSGGPRIPGRLIAGAAVVWLSHLFLDTLYNHARGVPMFWPLSSWSPALPVPWFSNVGSYRWPLTMRKLQIFAIEFACYLPLPAVVLAVRRVLKRKGVSRGQPSAARGGTGSVSCK
jgi:membrane-bound metal-dependent hydrolase YbcI (DUF457 family)